MMGSTGHEYGTKKKIWVPERNWPSVHPSDALTTELRRTCGEMGHIQGSCTTCIPGTARIFTKRRVELAIILYHTHDDFNVADPSSMWNCMTLFYNLFQKNWSNTPVYLSDVMDGTGLGTDVLLVLFVLLVPPWFCCSDCICSALEYSVDSFLEHTCARLLASVWDKTIWSTYWNECSKK